MKKFKFSKVSIVILAIAFTLGLTGSVAVFALGGLAEPVDLGVIDNFAVLAGSAVNDTNPSIINGDVGLSPAGWGGSALTCGEVVTGTVYSVDDSGPTGTCVTKNAAAILTPAKGALTTAYGLAAGQSTTDTIDTELGGTTLPAGVYVSAATTFEISTGETLTLDGKGNPDAVFIFNMASDADSLVTGANSKVDLIGDAQACNVFWRVGGSAVLGTETDFVGTIMADQSITDNGGSTVAGRFLARIAAVTLNNTHITVPTCADSTPDLTPATLNVIKHVSGGTASAGDWLLTVSSSDDGTGIGNAVGSTTATVYTLETGKHYSVKESGGPSGYTPSSSDECTITNAEADTTYNCTITNTYRRQSSIIGSIARVVAPIFEPTITILSTPVIVAPIIPKLPKTGFAPQENDIWYQSLLNNILNLFR